MHAPDCLYNPQRFAKVSAVFGQHLRNLRSSAGTGERTEDEEEEQEEEMYSWDSFVPRRVPLDALESGDDGSGPWSRYLATPETEHSRTPGKEFNYLSDSMVLLLQLCSDVVDVEATKLLLRVKYVEWTIIFASGVPVAPSVSSLADSSSSDEELSDDEDSSGSECSSSFLSECSCTCSECCQTCNSSSASSSSCSISSCSGLDSDSSNSDSDS